MKLHIFHSSNLLYTIFRPLKFFVINLNVSDSQFMVNTFLLDRISLIFDNRDRGKSFSAEETRFS